MRTKVFTCFISFLIVIGHAAAALPPWSYDPGPNPRSKIGKELIDLTANIPNFPLISEEVMGDQKFRPAFGPVPWRMLLGKNKVKILFIGQDATHIAEAAGRPATAGFGGRAQDLAAYFGVNEGAAFINTFAYTIRGQYGAYNTPYVYLRDGEMQIRFANFVDNGLWLMGQDVNSPIVRWRNDLIDWIIRNNRDSIKLIVTFGGAARDAVASFIEAKGGRVGAVNERYMKNIQIAETRLVYAGGNNEFPVVVNREGKDLYSQMQGRRLDYTKADTQEAVLNDIRENSNAYVENMVFTKGGPYQNGLIHPAQLGGYDLDEIVIARKKTRSLKGLPLNDGTKIRQELLVVELPHPTFLSRLGKSDASTAVARDLKVLAPYVKAGWSINPDPGMRNKFAEGRPYQYSRADIGPEYYDFGTPGTRMVPVSTASRMGGNPHVIVFGTRERARFDRRKIGEMTNALPAEEFSPEELFITRPRSKALRYVFDPGPGTEMARLMKENLDFGKIFKTKPGKTWKSNGIDAYYVKNHPEIGDFGHYRGTFNAPEVVILADPHGYDDLITARALTGARGQYLQGLMNDIGVGDKYLVLKTVPFGMDGASDEDWAYVLQATESYRSKVLANVLRTSTPKFILADGKYAQSEVKRLFGNRDNVKVINVNRSNDFSADMVEAGKKLKARVSGEMANIPRSHLSFYARIWEGTSGDRVLASDDKYRGLAFAEVAPAWAWSQRSFLAGEHDREVDVLLRKLRDNGFPMPRESLPSYLRRRDIDPGLELMQVLMKIFDDAA